MMAVCWPLSVSDFLKWAFVWQEQLLGNNTSCKGTIPNVTSSPLSVFPPHNLRSWQVYCGTDTVYKILAGLQDNSCLQETNILIGKTPKNIRQNQICFKRAIYKVLCVGVWKRNFFSDSLANSWKEFLIVNVTSVLIYSVRTLDTCLPKLMFIRTEYLKTFRSVSWRICYHILQCCW